MKKLLALLIILSIIGYLNCDSADYYDECIDREYAKMSEDDTIETIKDFAIQCQFEAENPECIDNSNDEACTARYEEMYQQYKQYVDSIFNTTQHKNYFSNKEDFKKGVEKQLRKLSEELGETELDDDLQQE
eukprot:TRINITY_DN414_c0_g1_i10.p3 TRINITY_DN414_c0_g1~~TRINITY_DN414_c0_g1_i10.p3  ORF type:complete len:132 (-),score=20.89 TRINITY_DN414_c0_g1_i10:88-483(-)